jgi:hypothetical protein
MRCGKSDAEEGLGLTSLLSGAGQLPEARLCNPLPVVGELRQISEI